MDLNKNDPLPLHYQLKGVLLEKIMYGQWSIGDLFPTEKDLMEQYEISSTTVRRSLSELVHEGWLERKAGKGTFVKKIPVQEKLSHLTGFFEEMTTRGLRPSAQVLRCQKIDRDTLPNKSSSPLSCFSDQDLFLFERIQKVNDEPVAYVQSYWPSIYGSKIAEHDLTTMGLYEIATKFVKLTLTKADQTISADIADRKVAEFLGIAIGAPVLRMERLAFSGSTPVEYSKNIYRADRYNYHVTLYHDSKCIKGLTLI